VTEARSSRSLVVALLAVAALAAFLPVVIARSRRLQVMRADLAEVVTECRARYAGSRTAADTAAVDAWQPPLHGEQRPRDPACGSYRRRNMLKGSDR
jgi:hypothetical protein